MDIGLERLRDVVDSMPGNYIVILQKGDDFVCEYCTSGVGPLAGMASDAWKTISGPMDFVFEEDREMIRVKLRKYAADLNPHNDAIEPIDFLFRIVHTSSGFVWIHLTALRIGLVDGTPTFVASLTDVTREMENSYVLMEESDRFIVVIEKGTKRILYANGGFYNMIGSSPAEARGKFCYELLCGVPAMKDDDNCLCFSTIGALTPHETYNPDNDAWLTLSGREIRWGEYDAYVFYMEDITEKKKMLDALNNTQRLFEAALDNSDLMIWEYDIVNSRCINSEKAGRDYDIPLVIENYPESLFETGFVPPETIEQIKDTKKRLLAGETGFSMDRRTINNDGESEWQKVDYTLEVDDDGNPVRAIVCGLDITAQKELETKYESQMAYRNNLASKALFSARLDLDADSILDYTSTDDRVGAIARDASGADDFLSSFFTTSVFDEDSPVVRDTLQMEALKQAFSMGTTQYNVTYRCTLLKKYLDLSVSLGKNPGNEHLEVFFVVEDATHSVVRDKAFQKVLAQSYDYIGLVDLETNKVDFLTRSTDRHLSHERHDDLIDYDERVRCAAEQHRNLFYSQEDFEAVWPGMKLDTILAKLNESPSYSFSYKLKSPEGKTETFTMAFGFVDETNSQMVFSCSNITAAVEGERRIQKKLEQALSEAQAADRAKTDFLSRMSHDMRTPMNGIIGMTTLTRDLPDLPEEAQRNLAAIDESSAYLLHLINDTLDMSKIEANRFTLNYEIVNVGDVIEHIISTIQPLVKAKGINLEFIPINAQLEYIRTDRMRVQQLFLNVLSNAVKFTPKGGTITMVVECLKRENGIAYDRISVSDTGCGMSPEFLEHVFDPFSQENSSEARQQEGTGLGMSIVKNLVELMGGTVEVESTLGEGTTVTAYLDFERVYDVPKEILEKDATKKSENIEGVRILLAEDNDLNATIACELLQKQGAIVNRAENGQQAVDMFTEAPQGTYDIILMDIRMPVMNGLDATRAIRALNNSEAAEIPIVAMTANAYDDDVQETLDAGMNAHLSKPVNPHQMFEEIAHWTVLSNE